MHGYHLTMHTSTCHFLSPNSLNYTCVDYFLLQSVFKWDGWKAYNYNQAVYFYMSATLIHHPKAVDKTSTAFNGRPGMAGDLSWAVSE